MSGSRPAVPWPWPAELDAVVAAPAYHRVVLDNERVRVLDTRIGAGETVPLHTHRWPGVLHVLAWSDFVRRDENGAIVLDSRGAFTTPPEVVWSPPLGPHTLENVGAREIRILSIELKDAAG